MPAQTSPDGWEAYLATLEAAADGLEACLDAADAADAADAPCDFVPAMPDVAAPTPAGPPPPGTEARREELLERLHLLTVRLEVRRDDVAHRLAGLAQRRPRVSERYAGALGRGLDVSG